MAPAEGGGVRTIRIPPIDWTTVEGARACVPVVVDWPELRLTMDQIVANAVAKLDGQPEPFPDHSFINVEIERPA